MKNNAIPIENIHKNISKSYIYTMFAHLLIFQCINITKQITYIY